MIRVVKDSFDMSQCEELTVEAGRPDTIDRAKLDALLKSGVSRISINPQTLQDNVLENIGRRHTADDIRRAMETMRAAQVRRLPVTEGGKLAGILSIDDIARSGKWDMECAQALCGITANVCRR